MRAETTVNQCDHHWTTRHEPGHELYWIRQCLICKEVDWDDLDLEINKLRENVLEGTMPEELIHEFLLKTCPGIYDPESEHFASTPRRFTRMIQELTDGTENFTFTTFAAHNQEMVVIRDIRFVSMCAHHIAPFSGVCHVGYIPEKRMAGISKFARHVLMYAHTLTNQEDLTSNIADSLEEILEPKGVAVVMRASHSCMSIRGALAHGTTTVTSAVRGVFGDHTRTAKIEFMEHIRG